MNEDFLAYVWKHQYFAKDALKVASGATLTVLRTGSQNSNAGPDFLNAAVRIEELTWAGSVELHVKASDWKRHNHIIDQKYDQVILHVVWENDVPVQRTDGTEIPVLALKDRVSTDLLTAYRNLQQPKQTIPCQPFLPAVSEISKIMMLERTLLERLENKAKVLQIGHRQNNQDWEEVAYKALLRGLGFKINQPGFEKLASQLPLPVLRKNRHHTIQTEALIFGQAGFLNAETEDAYIKALEKEFRFLQHKYQLPQPLQLADWNFLRLRPANFPTIRLAQLAALIRKQEHWFANLLQLDTLKAFYDFFSAEPSEYWQTHYMPGRSGKMKIGSLGKNSVNLLLINVVAPLLVAFSRERQQPELTDKALNLLEKLPQEKNTILEMYESLGFENRSAAGSQGLLELYHKYCSPVKCLQCTIGNSILKRAKTT